jgi:hypothetical protein
MGHVVLLGDSIFDNAAYVGRGPDVVAQLGAALPAGWRATLLAVDGAVAADVPRQLARLPADATDIILSVGGNDALGHVSLLDRRARSGAEVLCWFAEAIAGFSQRYRALLARLAEAVGPGRRVVVCTIYEGNLGGEVQRAAAAAIGMFDDVITRAAREQGWAVLELRDLCREPADYANPIEPSVRGGEKMARAIAELVSAATR